MPNAAPESVSAACTLCGLPIPAGAPFGQCPKCLLSLASSTGTDAGLPIDLLAPAQERRFGDYDVIEEIARGGMGVVYRARQRSLGREVALKMILGGELATADSVQRFLNEASAAAKLDHPNIVSVYEIGEHDLQHFFSMRLVSGRRNIATWAKGLNVRSDERARQIAQLTAKVARAVAFANERGVLHRDLKPSNILVDENDEPQVTDFGLAKLLTEEDCALTHSMAMLGSPSYMAPEQADGRHGDVTTATDVYGLGAVLYELLAGRPPFVGSSAIATARMVVDQEPPPLVSVPRDLATVCLKCLAKEPAQRYPSARALAEDLERFARGEPIRARRITTAEALWRWAKRRPRIAALLGALILAFVLGFAGVTWQWRAAVEARAGERQAREQATATVVDLYTNSGLVAAKDSDATRAALWFAQAAVTSPDDTPARRASLERWAAWRTEATVPIRAFESGVVSPGSFAWRPSQDAIIVIGRYRTHVTIWDLNTEKCWLPDSTFHAAAWMPDGSQIAVADGETVRLLEYPSARELARVPCITTTPCVSISQNGSWIAIGAPEPFLWNPKDGTNVPLPRECGQPVGFEFSRDGQRLLVTTATQRGVCPLSEPSRFTFPPVESLTKDPQGFLGDGQHFVTYIQSGAGRVLNSETGEIVENLSEPFNKTEGRTTISPDGKFIARNPFTLLERPGKTHSFALHRNRIEGFDFSRDGQWLATASSDDTVRLWRLPEVSGGEPIGWHQDGANGVSLSPDGRFVATGQDGRGIVRIWRRATPPTGRSLRGFFNSEVRLSDDGRLLVPKGSNDHVERIQRTRVFSVENLEPLGPEIAPGGSIADAIFAPGNASVYVLSISVPARGMDRGSGSLQQWDFRSGQRVAEPIPLPAAANKIALHPDGKRIAVYGPRRSLFEVDLATREVRTLHTNDPNVPADYMAAIGCRYSVDGKFLFAWGLLQPPIVRDAAAQNVFTPPSWQPEAVWAVDLRNDLAVSVSYQSRLQVLTLPDFAPAAPKIQDTNWLFFACFSPDGAHVLTGGRGRIARVWDWRTGEQHCPGLAHEDEIFAGVFLPDSDGVATAGQDKAIRFWDRHTGLPLRPPVRQSHPIASLTLSPDGRELLSHQRGGDDIRLYRIADLLPRPPLPPADALLLAEIEAAAEIHRGTLEPLSPAAWMKKWQEFRAKYPDWHRW